MKTKKELRDVIADAGASQHGNIIDDITDAAWAYMQPRLRHPDDPPDNQRIVDVFCNGRWQEATYYLDRKIPWLLTLDIGCCSHLVCWKEKDPPPADDQLPKPPDPFEKAWAKAAESAWITKGLKPPLEKGTCRFWFNSGYRAAREGTE